MSVIRGLESAQFSGVVLTIGNFDGIHRGHRAIIAAGRRRAHATKTQLVAMTFDPHPAVVLTPDRVPGTLTPLDEKIQYLESTGVDVVVVVRSQPEFFQISPDDFITDVIMGRFAPLAMVEGASFVFGAHHQGNVKTLQAAARNFGFDMQVIEPIRAGLGGHPDTVISSSLIRHLLSSGTVDKAAVCLGRPYTLIGNVVTGAGRGKTLGFPTANVEVNAQLIPAEGVYAGRAEVDNEKFTAAISIGRYPTFNGNNLAIEAFLVDFDANIYEQPIRLEFIDWLRGQEKFDSADALTKQMAIDVEQTRKIVAESKP